MQRHNLTCIATDGFSIVPVTVDAVVSSSGERYDVVVHAITDKRISTNDNCFTVYNCFIVILFIFIQI